MCAKYQLESISRYSPTVWTLKMARVFSVETSVTAYQSIWLHISDEIKPVILFGAPQKVFD